MKKKILVSHLAAAIFSILLPGCDSGPDFEPPRVYVLAPYPDAVLSKSVEIVQVEARDNKKVEEVELLINGQFVDRDLRAPWELRWPTDSFRDGDYLITVRAYDKARNRAEDTLTVRLRDLVLIHEITIANMCCDQIFGPQLEIEAHLYDSGGKFLGCSGERSGLAGVNQDNTSYLVEAYFQKPPHGLEKLLFEEVKHKRIYIKIIEDDTDACPIQENATRDNLSSTDDEIGRSAIFAGADLLTPQVMSFEDVTHLLLAAGRRTQ